MFDLDKLVKQIEEAEKKSTNEDFWKDNFKATNFLKALTFKKNLLEKYTTLNNLSKEIIEICEISIELNDENDLPNIIQNFETLQSLHSEISIQLKLNGKFDSRNAIIGIKQGAGGIDAQDWSEILVRMYKRWSERKGFKLDVLHLSTGDEAGLKSIVMKIEGNLAYGLLQSEKGAHRLVRISPFDTGQRRHTSFSLVEIMPEFEKEEEIVIDPNDLRIDVFIAGGAGGQSVQKNSTAVRITHIPTNIKVSVQNERSQLHNRELAMKILQSRIMELEIIKNRQKEAEIKGEHISADFGSQIRSYVMHPYKLVKDHRSNVENSNIDDVLDGNIDSFIESYLISKIK